MKYKGKLKEAWKTKVKYMGVFSMRGLYKELMEYLKDLDYTDEDRYKYFETYYYEKRSSDPKEATSMWIWIRTDKNELIDSSNFFRYHMNIHYHVRFMKDIEVMSGGEKLKVQQGEVEVIIHPYIEIDWKGMWQSHWLLKHLLDFYVERLWWKSFQEKKHRVKDDAKEVQRRVKDYFEMQSNLPLEAAAFTPSHGYRDEPNQQ